MRRIILISGLSWVLVVAVLVPVLWLGLSAYPTIDDFPCSLGPRDHGLLTSIMGWYHSWTARYFSAFLWGICPLVFDWQWGYHLTPIFTVVFHLACAWGFFKIIENEWYTPPAQRLLLSMIWLVVYTMGAPSLPQSFYYYNGVVCYQPANAMLLLAIGCYVRLWNFDFRLFLNNAAAFLLLCICVVFIVGSNEASMMAISMVSGAFWFFYLVEHRKISWIFSGVVALNLLCVAIVLFSPATHNRMELSGSYSRTPGFVATETMYYIGKQAWLWFGNPFLIGSSVLLVHFFRLYHLHLKIHRFWLLAGVGLLIFVCIHIPSFLGEGMVQGRTANSFFYLFMMIWVLFLLRFYTVLAPVSVLASIAILIFFLNYKALNISLLYTDIGSGRAAAHQHEFENRMRLIATTPGDTVYVPRYRYLPKSSYLSDIREYQGSNYYDRFYARMYGKKWIDFIDNKAVIK